MGILDQLFAGGYGQGGGLLGGMPPWLQNTGGPQAGWQPPVDNVGQPGSLDPKWQALLAGQTDPYGGQQAQLPPNSAPAAGVARATVPQISDSGFGQQGDGGNPIAGLLGGLGNGIGSLFGGMQANGQPQAQMPGQQQGAPAAATPGLFDRLGAGWQGLTHGGLTSAAGGLFTGQRQDPQGLMERALVSKGLAPEMARAAVANPALLQTVLPAAFGTKLKPVQIGQDALGHPIHGTFNELTGKYYDIAGREIGAGNQGGGVPGGVSTADPVYNEKGYDEAFLKSLDPVTQAAVKAVVEGRMPATGRNLQQLIPIASRYDQNFTGTQDYTTRMNTAKLYTSGEGARGLRSAGTTINHGTQLMKAIDDLHNYTFAPGVTNRLTGEVQRQYDPKYQAALKSFNTNAELYAKELDFALTGKSTVSGAEHLRQMFSPWASGEENKASLLKTLEMLNGRLEQHAHTYNQGMKSLKQPLELLDPKDATKLQTLIGPAEVHGGAPAPSQPSTTAAQTAQDQQAIAWAQANPADPRAAKIKQRLGVQ